MGARGSAFLWTRRFVVAAVVVALSLAGHAAGSVMLPSAAGLLIAVVVALSLTLGVGAGTSSVRLFGILIAAQALLHVIFVLSSDCATDSMSLLPTTTTLLGHVLASVAAVAVLRHGDRVLNSWTALLTSAFSAPTGELPAIPGRPVLAVPLWSAGTHGADGHLTNQVRRGPPAA